jgi:hypothetical protein
MINAIKRWVENWLVKGLPEVDYESVITSDKNGRVFLNGQLIGERELMSLKEEVKFIEQTVVWRILTNTLYDQAKQIMFEKSTCFEDMRTGKAMLRNIEIQTKIMELIKQFYYPEKKKVEPLKVSMEE